MRKIGIGFLLALLVGWQNSDIGDPVEPSGGVSWPLTADGDLDMNGNEIDNVTSLTSASADPADAGVIRLGNNEKIAWESNPTGTDRTLFVNPSQQFEFSDEVVFDMDVIIAASGEILSNGGAGGNNPKIVFGSDSVTFVRQSGTAESLVVAREFQADSKITLTTASLPLRWSGASQIDSGGVDGRIRIRDASGSNGTCFIISSNAFDARQANCTAPAEMIGRFGVQESASPTVPGPCSAATIGYRQVVNDTDDGAGTAICYCGMTDDSTYDWLDVSDNTACPHY